MSVLTSAHALQSQLGSDSAPVLLDVRWSLAAPDGKAEYLSGHIPAAVYVDLETELSGAGLPTDGRHPLPSREDLQSAARRWGINTGDSVVVYDSAHSLAAARAWWLLRNAGVDDVTILDGGLAAWRAAQGEIESGDVIPTPGNVELTQGHLPTINIDEAATFPQHGTLIDARAAERYRGDVEPIDPVAGHIPGATNSPTAENVTSAGTFLPLSDLSVKFRELGLTPGSPIAVYCGSGVTAAHHIAALHIAGYQAALYPGSWSAWSNHPSRPVATGTTV